MTVTIRVFNPWLISAKEMSSLFLLLHTGRFQSSAHAWRVLMPILPNAKTLSTGFPSSSLAMPLLGARPCTRMQDAPRQDPGCVSQEGILQVWSRHAGSCPQHSWRRDKLEAPRASPHVLPHQAHWELLPWVDYELWLRSCRQSLCMIPRPLHLAPAPFLQHSRRHYQAHLSSPVLLDNLTLLQCIFVFILFKKKSTHQLQNFKYHSLTVSSHDKRDCAAAPLKTSQWLLITTQYKSELITMLCRTQFLSHCPLTTGYNVTGFFWKLCNHGHP